MNIDQALKDMNSTVSNISNKEVTTKAKEVETVLSNPPVQGNSNNKVVPTKVKGRSSIMSVSMQAKVVRLAKRYFFMRSIAGMAGISTDTIEKYLGDEAFKRFSLAFTHARDRWITFHQNLLTQYATDKKTKDWHAIKYLLTIADKEFSERKYLTEAVSNQDAKILMLIKAEQLTIASKQGKDMLKGVKTVNNTPLQSEPISLLPFQEEDRKNKGKAKVRKGK